MAYLEELKLQRTAQLDAFNRLRVSLPYTLFEGDILDDENPLAWQTLTANGGTATYVLNTSSVTLTADGTNGSRVVRQTRRYLPYQPGKSMAILMTGVLCEGTPQANGRTRFGIFDDAADKSVGTLNGNGLFFELNGTSFRSS